MNHESDRESMKSSPIGGICPLAAISPPLQPRGSTSVKRFSDSLAEPASDFSPVTSLSKLGSPNSAVLGVHSAKKHDLGTTERSYFRGDRNLR